MAMWWRPNKASTIAEKLSTKSSHYYVDEPQRQIGRFVHAREAPLGSSFSSTDTKHYADRKHQASAVLRRVFGGYRTGTRLPEAAAVGRVRPIRMLASGEGVADKKKIRDWRKGARTLRRRISEPHARRLASMSLPPAPVVAEPKPHQKLLVTTTVSGNVHYTAAAMVKGETEA